MSEFARNNNGGAGDMHSVPGARGAVLWGCCGRDASRRRRAAGACVGVCQVPARVPAAVSRDAVLAGRARGERATCQKPCNPPPAARRRQAETLAALLGASPLGAALRATLPGSPAFVALAAAVVIPTVLLPDLAALSGLGALSVGSAIAIGLALAGLYFGAPAGAQAAATTLLAPQTLPQVLGCVAFVYAGGRAAIGAWRARRTRGAGGAWRGAQGGGGPALSRPCWCWGCGGRLLASLCAASACAAAHLTSPDHTTCYARPLDVPSGSAVDAAAAAGAKVRTPRRARRRGRPRARPVPRSAPRAAPNVVLRKWRNRSMAFAPHAPAACSSCPI